MLHALFGKTAALPTPEQALPGRSRAIEPPERHLVNGHSPAPAPSADHRRILLGLGCFWGAERRFWSLPGVHVTAVGYAGGHTPHPTYEEVCSGRTGHAEVVMVVFDPARLPLDELLAVFWEAHDPTQGMRQGNDVGTQYRSAIYTDDAADHECAQRSRDRYQAALRAHGIERPITTEIAEQRTFYFAEDYHQQYLARNPQGYCGLRGLNVACPGPADASAA